MFAPTGHEFRIYGDDNAQLYAVVDEDDYQFLLQWLWSPKWSRGGRKCYLRRVVSEGSRGSRIQRTIFLHQAVMARKGDIPPSPLHVIIDHRDSDEMNCRKANLRWATHSMNALNINGARPYDLEELMA